MKNRTQIDIDCRIIYRYITFSHCMMLHARLSIFIKHQNSHSTIDNEENACPCHPHGGRLYTKMTGPLGKYTHRHTHTHIELLCDDARVPVSVIGCRRASADVYTRARVRTRV